METFWFLEGGENTAKTEHNIKNIRKYDKKTQLTILSKTLTFILNSKIDLLDATPSSERLLIFWQFLGAKIVKR